jgi:serine/threonine-protein kinase
MPEQREAIMTTVTAPEGRSDKPLPREELHEGHRIAHFRIERLLGRGGMGAVYLARDLALDRPVALKVLAPDRAESGLLRERFLREARLQARLNHPNICHIYFTGEEEGRLFFAMEYIQGETLQARLDRGRLSVREALELCRQAALGLQEAHAHGLTHRDIKPSNLMVDEHGQVKLLDFGIVKQTAADHVTGRAPLPNVTADALAVIGTPSYMAPEQALGRADHRTDIYALGATLHQLIAGLPPFVAENTMALLAQHLERPRPHLLEKRWRDAPIDMLCDRMMAKRPEDRFQSYDEMIAAMDRILPTRRVGYGTRFASMILDWVMVSLVAQFIVHRFDAQADADSLPVHLSFLAIMIVYGTTAHALVGRTIGQQILGVEVVGSPTGARPRPLQALVRVLVLWSNGALALPVQATGILPVWVTNAAFYSLLAVLCIASLLDREHRTPWDRASRTDVRWAHR